MRTPEEYCHAFFIEDNGSRKRDHARALHRILTEFREEQVSRIMNETLGKEAIVQCLDMLTAELGAKPLTPVKTRDEKALEIGRKVLEEMGL